MVPRASATSVAVAASIGWTATPTWSRTLFERGATVRQRVASGAGQVAAQHRGAADELDGNLCRRRDRVGHETCQRPLAELAGQEAPDEVRLLGGEAGVERVDDRRTPRLGSRSRARVEPVERVVEVPEPERGDGCTSAECGGAVPPDADPTLAGDTGEACDRDDDLVGIESAEERSEGVDLGAP